MTAKDDPKTDPDDFLNLAAKREEFLETFFRKGAELTDQLLQELQVFRERIATLEEENNDLRLQLASDDAIRDLLTRVKELEEERQSLRQSTTDMVGEHNNYTARFAEMERELDQMANLYVASFQLHATLDAAEVLSVIEQMLMQFIGAAEFAIFLRREHAPHPVLQPVHVFHCDHIRGATIDWNDGPIGEAAATQVNYIAAPADAQRHGLPIACIPMIFGRDAIGVIVIYKLLEQKTDFVDIDFELFKLLAQHSAAAIVGAGLLARCGNVPDSLNSFASL
ncbi:MAG: GAF domain-containing protein [Proteobacteria bacterium]|nr:GAF domain-containing protein [Pseudomonadota bacterium]